MDQFKPAITTYKSDHHHISPLRGSFRKRPQPADASDVRGMGLDGCPSSDHHVATKAHVNPEGGGFYPACSRSSIETTSTCYLQKNMDQNNTFHWLHISDYHEGQKFSRELWPQIRSRLIENIKNHCENNGPIDLVIFSGDIAFKGDTSEYHSIKDELVNLWDVFRSMGQEPKLFLIPGNHDLVRPPATSPLTILAPMLRLQPGVKAEIFNDDSSTYRKELMAAFSNYQQFVDELSELIPTAMHTKGKIPGDSSGVMNINGLRIGIIGLNTAWTQLSPLTEKGQLDLYIEQASSVTNGDIPTWISANHLNLLVTHHPTDWLQVPAIDDFNTEINVAGYFDAHLFGHMHENRPEMKYTPWGEQRAFQVASLFGMEKVNGETRRKHGYFFVKADAKQAQWRVWPRLIEKKTNGWDLGRDPSYLKGDNLHFDMGWTPRLPIEQQPKKLKA